MKYAQIYLMLIAFILYASCKGQNKTELPKASIMSEKKAALPSYGPRTITRNIIQDRRGNIWIAAFDGIFKYDGKSFTNITIKVSQARFFSVLEDRKGNLWFGSVGSGVYNYDGKSFQHFTTKDGLANNEVGSIYEDKAGNIWFGVNGGASRYDGKYFRNYMMNEGQPNIDNDVNSIIEDKTGKFWFGTRGNAFIYDGKKFTTITHLGKPFTNIRSIIEDKKGTVWLGGNDGLWRYDGNTFTNLTKRSVNYITEDKKGNIWTSSESAYGLGWALSCYEEKFLSNKKPTVTEIKLQFDGSNGLGDLEVNKRMIFGILEASDGSIWFGTGDGVYRYDGKTITDFRGKKIGE